MIPLPRKHERRATEGRGRRQPAVLCSFGKTIDFFRGDNMRARGFLQSLCAATMMLLLCETLCSRPVTANQESGTVIPAESRPCVDCHAFEFMQRALQDLKKTAFNLDSRTESLVLRAEKRALCDCMPANALS
ncbi:hypothetical protein MATL_G00196820 [Megalops atlanticus]|uniref:NELL2-interacting cell ontogeny regulator 1 n=1 Tax=Megalops atlanticus TaxID=7932 RepID=A0A9D3SZD6_MEGAT|nr:hypothetical protein MATL_G00196820 [Megalops atlanticus]